MSEPQHKQGGFVPWYHLPPEEWEALPDVIKVRGQRFCGVVTKEMLEDYRAYCEAYDQLLKSLRRANE